MNWRWVDTNFFGIDTKGQKSLYWYRYSHAPAMTTPPIWSLFEVRSIVKVELWFHSIISEGNEAEFDILRTFRLPISKTLCVTGIDTSGGIESRYQAQGGIGGTKDTKTDTGVDSRPVSYP